MIPGFPLPQKWKILNPPLLDCAHFPKYLGYCFHDSLYSLQKYKYTICYLCPTLNRLIILFSLCKLSFFPFFDLLLSSIILFYQFLPSFFIYLWSSSSAYVFFYNLITYICFLLRLPMNLFFYLFFFFNLRLPIDPLLILALIFVFFFFTGQEVPPDQINLLALWNRGNQIWL